MRDFIGRVGVNGIEVGRDGVLDVTLAFVGAAEYVPGAGVVTIEEDGLLALPFGIIEHTI